MMLSRILKHAPMQLDEGITISKSMYEHVMGDDNFKCGFEIEFADPGLIDDDDDYADRYEYPLLAYVRDEFDEHGFDISYTDPRESDNEPDYDEEYDDVDSNLEHIDDVDYDELISQTDLVVRRTPQYTQGDSKSSNKHGRKLIIDGRIKELYSTHLGKSNDSPRKKFNVLLNKFNGNVLQLLYMLKIANEYMIEGLEDVDIGFFDYLNHPINDVEYYAELANDVNEHTTVWFERKDINYTTTTWELVTDMTYGVDGELVSPPMNIKRAMNSMRQAFNILNNIGVQTTHACGMHVSISYGGFSEMNAIDRLKLIMLLDEEYVLDLFNRTSNTYTVPHINKLRKEVSALYREGGNPSDNLDQFMADLADKIDNEKFRTVNFSKLSQGYLEFRIMGDDDYLNRYDEIVKQIIKFAAVLYAAYDPDVFKTKYYKTLYKMVHFDDHETSKEFDKSDGGIIAGILMKNAAAPRQALRAYNGLINTQKDDTISSELKRAMSARYMVHLIVNSIKD